MARPTITKLEHAAQEIAPGATCLHVDQVAVASLQDSLGSPEQPKKVRIGDPELCMAIQQVMMGQADDLGGGVFKKRLNLS